MAQFFEHYIIYFCDFLNLKEYLLARSIVHWSDNTGVLLSNPGLGYLIEGWIESKTAMVSVILELKCKLRLKVKTSNCFPLLYMHPL